ncbi:unnamed protein product, partial [Mesorhabditis belari]|uniref:Uncharacterized protein n=1 Tax=Mesorhabditis belari TaxID=2138241 RepID=A0AAF3F895_9BILA
MDLQPRSPSLLTPNRSPTDSPFPGRRSLPQTPTQRLRRSLPSTPRSASPRPIPAQLAHLDGVFPPASSSGASSKASSCEASPRQRSPRRRQLASRRAPVAMRDSGFVESSSTQDAEEEDTMGQLRSFDMTKGGLIDRGFQTRPPQPIVPNLLARRATECEESGQSRSINFLLNGEEVQLEILLESALETSPFSPHITMFMVVYSVTSRESFTTAANLLYRIFQHRKNTPVPVILVGNKMDLKRKKLVGTIEGRMLAKIYKCAFVELSALMAMNVDTMWKEILTQIRGVEADSRSLLERLVDRGRSIARSCEEIVHRIRRGGDGLSDLREMNEPKEEDGQEKQVNE